MKTRIRSTTVIAVQRGGVIAMVGDGQVTQNQTVLKTTARKVRRLHDGKVVAGFAGATADALTLFERFEQKLKDHPSLVRAAVELAKEWRSERRLRNLEALMLVADHERMLLLTGNGDVVEPDAVPAAAGTGVATGMSVLAIGSGSPVALGAARALLQHTELGAEAIAREAMRVAAEIDVYTNAELSVELLPDSRPHAREIIAEGT